MKKIFFILLLLPFLVNAQTDANYLRVRDSLRLNGKVVKGISNDSTSSSKDSTKLITEAAAKKYTAALVQSISLSGYHKSSYYDSVFLGLAAQAGYNKSNWDAAFSFANGFTIVTYYSTLDGRYFKLSDTAAALTNYRIAIYTNTNAISTHLSLINLLISDSAYQAGILAAHTTAIAGKEPTISTGSTNYFWSWDKTWRQIAYSQISSTPDLSVYETLAHKGAASGYAPLGSDSKIPSSYMPALALNNVWPVSSQSAMLALSSAVVGDVAIRSDSSLTYVLKSSDYTHASSWVQLLFPTAPVLSVAGMIGNVTLTTSNVSEGTGLYYTSTRFTTDFNSKSTSNLTEGTNLYYTDTRARAAHSFTAGSGAYNSTTGVITIPTNTSQLTNGANFISLTSLSSTVTGITYTNTTGVFSLTSGYQIPTTTQVSNWNALVTMSYPGAGIAVSTGSAWGTSIIDNSGNWNTAYSSRLTTVSATNMSGSYSGNTLTISIPQAIGTSATPTFGGMTLNGLLTGTSGKFIASGGYSSSYNLSTSINDATSTLSGVTSSFLVSNYGNGYIAKLTLSDNFIDNAFIGYKPSGTATSNKLTLWVGNANTSANGLSIDGNGAVIVTSSVTASSFIGSGASLTSIPNGALVNSAITIQGTSTSLGGSVNVINGTGFVKASGTTISYDNSTYLTTSSASSTYQLILTAGTGVTISSNTVSIGQGVSTSNTPTFAGGTYNGIVTINTSTRGLILNRASTSQYTGTGLQTNGTQYWMVGMRENLTSNNYIVYNEITGHDAITVASSSDAVTLTGSLTSTAGSFIVSGGYTGGGAALHASQYSSGSLSTTATALRVDNNGGLIAKIVMSDNGNSDCNITYTNSATTQSRQFGIGSNGTYNDFVVDGNHNTLIGSTSDHSGEKLQITGSGYFSGSVTASSGFFNSDIRLKNVSETTEFGMITYTWKDHRDDKIHFGYSAQAIQLIYPNQVNADAKGYLSINYVEVLVKEVDDLKRDVAYLKSKIK